MKAKPRTNNNYKPTANGCGAYNLQVDFSTINMKEIAKCCEQHDFCYVTCNASKMTCDRQFKFCLSQFCESDNISQNRKSSKIIKFVLYYGILKIQIKINVHLKWSEF